MERKEIEDLTIRLFEEEFNLIVTPQTILEDSGINSMVFIQFIVLIEEELCIELDDEYLNVKKFSVVDDIIEFIAHTKND